MSDDASIQEMADLIADAKRYRFLRDTCAMCTQHVDDDDETRVWQIATPWRRGKTVDEAVDELMRERKP